MNMRKMVERLTEFDDNVIRTLIDRGHIKTGSAGSLYICDLYISEHIFSIISRYIEFCLFLEYCSDLPEVDYDRIHCYPHNNLSEYLSRPRPTPLSEMCSNVERILKYKTSLGKEGVVNLLERKREPARWHAPNKTALKGVAGLGIHFENCISEIELPMNFLFLKQEDIYLGNTYLARLNLYTYAKGEESVPTPTGVISIRNSMCTVFTPGESPSFIPRIFSSNSKVSFETSDISDKSLSIIKNYLIKLHQVTNFANPSIMGDAFRISCDKSSRYSDIVSYTASPEVLTSENQEQIYKLSGLVHVTVTPEYLKQNPQLLEIHDLHITEGVYLDFVSSGSSTAGLKEKVPELKSIWSLIRAANSTIQFLSPTTNTTIKYNSLLLSETNSLQDENYYYPLIYPKTLPTGTVDTLQPSISYIEAFLKSILKTEEFAFEMYCAESSESGTQPLESTTTIQEINKREYERRLSPLLGAESISYISNKPNKSFWLQINR